MDNDKLIQKIYRATINHEEWPEVFDSFVDFAQSSQSNDESSAISEEVFGHILQADQIKQSLDIKQQTLNHVIDHLPIGVAIIDSDLTIISQNPLAQYLLQTNGELILKKFTDSLNQLKQNKNELEDDINDFACSEVVLDDKQLYIGINSYQPDQTQDNTLYITYIYESGHLFNSDVLANIYGISQGEAKVIDGLFKYGHTKKAANFLNISENTFRTHIKAILKKTSTHSQAELMIKLLDGPHWLSRLKQHQDTLSILEDKLLNEDFISLGDNSGQPTLFFPSMFGAVWDLLESDLYGWGDFLKQHNILLIIVNTGVLIEEEDWRLKSMEQISSILADKIKQKFDNQLLDIIGYNTGCAYALNVSRELEIKKIKLISPVLPQSMIAGSEYGNADYKKIAIANRIPRSLWFKVSHYLINHISTQSETYYQRRLANQTEPQDKQKVIRWAQNPLLLNMTSSYTKKCNRKIAADLLLIGKEWNCTPNPKSAVLLIKGDLDSYSNEQGFERFIKQYDNAVALIMSDVTSTYEKPQWQEIFTL